MKNKFTTTNTFGSQAQSGTRRSRKFSICGKCRKLHLLKSFAFNLSDFSLPPPHFPTTPSPIHPNYAKVATSLKTCSALPLPLLRLLILWLKPRQHKRYICVYQQIYYIGLYICEIVSIALQFCRALSKWFPQPTQTMRRPHHRYRDGPIVGPHIISKNCRQPFNKYAILMKMFIFSLPKPSNAARLVCIFRKIPF